MAPIELIAIMKPKPGKADRLQELLGGLAVEVKANEPETLKYHLQRETKGKGDDTFVMVETYASKQAVDAHGKTPYFQAFMKKSKEEGLLESMKIMFTKGVAGYASRL